MTLRRNHNVANSVSSFLLMFSIFINPFQLCYANPEPGLYELETQTLLPHLDEMRRNTSVTTICLTKDTLKQLFPILSQPGLKDCFLRQHKIDKETTFFRLQCPGLNGAEGRAKLETRGNRLKALLDAKLGGKNMTFTQTTRAKRLGACR